MSKITRKIINRHNKKDLLKFARENGLDVKTSMSKKIIVDKIFKNKDVRSRVPIKEKRKLSDKQRANLERFRFKKTQDKVLDDSAKISKPIEVAAPSKPNPNSNKDVEPTASNKNEPAPVSLKQNPTTQINKSKKVAEATIIGKDLPKAQVQTFIKDKEPVTDFKTGEKKEKQEIKSLQTKIDVKTRDKASKEATKLKQGLGGTQFDAKRQRALDSHTARLRRNIYMNAKKKISSVREHAISTYKSTDLFDRRLFNRVTRNNKERMNKAIEHSKKIQEAGFVGEIADITQDIGFDSVEELLKLEADFKSGKITQLQYRDGIERIRFMKEASARGITGEQAERLLIKHLEDFKDDRIKANYIRLAQKQNKVEKLNMLIKLKEQKNLDDTTQRLIDNIIQGEKEQLMAEQREEGIFDEKADELVGEAIRGAKQDIVIENVDRKIEQLDKTIKNEEKVNELVDNAISGATGELAESNRTATSILEEIKRRANEKIKDNQIDRRADELVGETIEKGKKELVDKKGQELRDIVENDRVTQRTMKILGDVFGVTTQIKTRKTDTLIKLLRETSLTEEELIIILKGNFMRKSDDEIKKMLRENIKKLGAKKSKMNIEDKVAIDDLKDDLMRRRPINRIGGMNQGSIGPSFKRNPMKEELDGQ